MLFRSTIHCLRCLLSLVLAALLCISGTAFAAFSDVPDGSDLSSVLTTLTTKNIIHGYQDGTFRPDRVVNRAEFLKVVLGAKSDEITYSLPDGRQRFEDVHFDEWYSAYVYFAWTHNIVQGYGDGLFHPDRTINLAEGLRILFATFEVALTPVGNGEEWYAPLFREAEARSLLTFIDDSKPDHIMTRRDMAYVLDAFLGAHAKENPPVEEVPSPTPEPSPIVPPTPAPPTPPAQDSPAVTAFRNTGILERGKVRLEWTPAHAKLLERPEAFADMLSASEEALIQVTGLEPYNGAIVTFRERCAYDPTVNPNVATPSCPYGHLTIPAWGYAGNPVTLSDLALNEIIRDWNSYGMLTFGLVHELSHNFDSVSTNSQYLVYSSATEAWANIRLLYALKQGGFAVRLSNRSYDSFAALYDFYAPFYTEYTAKGYSFTDLYDSSATPGHLSDYYFMVLVKKLETVPEQSLFDTTRFYANNGRRIRYFYSTERQEKLSQFVYYWSAFAKYNLAPLFETDRFPILDSYKAKITQFLALSPQMQTVDNMIAMENATDTPAETIPDVAKTAIDIEVANRSLGVLGTYRKFGNVWGEVVRESGGTQTAVLYNAKVERAYMLPWWNYSYLAKYNAWNIVGAPVSIWYRDSRGWVQQFENNWMIFTGDPTLDAVISPL